MMMIRAAQQPSVLPLLAWSEQREIDRLQVQRDQLKTRIEALPLRAHKRVELEYQLRVVTARQLQLQNDIGDRR